MKLIITSVIFIPGILSTCSVLTPQCVNFTWSIEHALHANDDGEKTLKLTYPGNEERQK